MLEFSRTKLNEVFDTSFACAASTDVHLPCRSTLSIESPICLENVEDPIEIHRHCTPAHAGAIDAGSLMSPSTRLDAKALELGALVIIRGSSTRSHRTAHLRKSPARLQAQRSGRANDERFHVRPPEGSLPQRQRRPGSNGLR